MTRGSYRVSGTIYDVYLFRFILISYRELRILPVFLLLNSLMSCVLRVRFDSSGPTRPSWNPFSHSHLLKVSLQVQLHISSSSWRWLLLPLSHRTLGVHPFRSLVSLDPYWFFHWQSLSHFTFQPLFISTH